MPQSAESKTVRIAGTRGRFSKVDRTTLEHLLELGHSQSAIADMLDVNRTTIQRRCYALGLTTARRGPRAGAGHPSWRNGRRLDKTGYVLVWAPLHPHANQGTGAVPEHRLLMEVLQQRYLDPAEVVHHQDDHPAHNWPDNLQLYATNADHLRDELTGRAYATSPRRLRTGEHLSNRTRRRCPDTAETLAQCPAEIQTMLADYIELHRPTSAHRSLPRRVILRTGAHRPPFPAPSTA